MVSQSSVIDLQKVVAGAAKLELKALLAGVECLQVWIGQAAKLSHIASDSLEAIQDNKGSISEVARKLTEFGKQNADAFEDLSSRLSKSYYDELRRLTRAVEAVVERPKKTKKGSQLPVPAKKTGRRKSTRKKIASRPVLVKKSSKPKLRNQG